MAGAEPVGAYTHGGKTISTNGKTLRGSHDHPNGQKPLHVVNGWAKHVNFRLGSISVDDKSNEIPAVHVIGIAAGTALQRVRFLA